MIYKCTCQGSLSSPPCGDCSIRVYCVLYSAESNDRIKSVREELDVKIEENLKLSVSD